MMGLPNTIAALSLSCSTTLLTKAMRGSFATTPKKATDGVPESWFDLGFHGVADFWSPWCAAIVDGEVASLACAARLTDSGAELGLVTAKAFRGRGFGAAATAGWSRLPTLRSRTLFYSTDRDNASSKRVASRLGLRHHGASLRIT